MVRSLSDLQGYLAITTWVALILGFAVNPAFFLLGMIAFLGAAGLWTVETIKNKVSIWTIVWVWAIPVVLITFFGWAIMILPNTEEIK